MVFAQILDPVFSPLLELPILFAVLIISFVVSIIIVLAYKFFTDQTEMKSLKDQIKGFQKQIKENKKNPEKVMKIQKQSMDINMKYMMKSMKPTLFTFLPIIIIFGWLNAHLGFAPIEPGMPFTTSVVLQDGVGGTMTIEVPQGVEIIGNATQPITGNAVTWEIKGSEGEHLLAYKFNEQEYTKDVLITDEYEYAPISQDVNSATVKSIRVNNEKLIVLNLFGWKLGWLGTYIILSLIFSMSLRKLLKIY